MNVAISEDAKKQIEGAYAKAVMHEENARALENEKGFWRNHGKQMGIEVVLDALGIKYDYDEDWNLIITD